MKIDPALFPCARKLLFSLVVLALLPSSPGLAATVTAKKADTFVDSIGINIKLDRGRYGNFSSVVKPALADLGIRHYLDGKLQSVDRPKYQELWDDLGMRMLYGAVPYEGTLDNDPQSIRNRVRTHSLDYIWGVQGVNEPDIFLVTGFGWSNQVYTDRNNVTRTNTTSEYFASRAYQNDLYHWMNADPLTANIPVGSPAMAYSSNVSKVTPVDADFGSFHHYTKRDRPDQDLAAILDRTGWYGGTAKICSEFGWLTSGTGNEFQAAKVSEKVQAENIISAFLVYHQRGVLRSYLHELIDANWGIVGSGSGTPKKKAYYALRDVIDLFSDASWNSSTKQWSSPTFTPQPLDITYSGLSGLAKVQLYQKSDGSYILAFARMADRVDDNGNDILDPDTFDLSIAEGISNASWKTLDPATGQLISSPVSAVGGTNVNGLVLPAGNGFLVFRSGAEAGSGAAADTYLLRNDNTPNGNETEIVVKSKTGVDAYERLGLVRFDTSGVALPIGSAAFELDAISVGGNFTFRVLGVKETAGDENFNEGSLHWSNSVLSDSSDDGYDNTKVEVIGDFSLTSSDTAVSVTSQAMLDFINADTNGRVTFLIARLTSSNATSTFASKENASAAGPRLVLGGTSAVEISALADAYVRSGSNEGNNYGSLSELAVKDDGGDVNNTRRAFLKFSLNGFNSPVASATLSLRVTGAQQSNDPAAVEVFKVYADGWGENSIRYNNQPAENGLIATFSGIDRNSVGLEVVYDVTAYVNSQIASDGTVSFLLKQPANQSMFIGFGSREAAAADRPLLIIQE